LLYTLLQRLNFCTQLSILTVIDFFVKIRFFFLTILDLFVKIGLFYLIFLDLFILCVVMRLFRSSTFRSRSSALCCPVPISSCATISSLSLCVLFWLDWVGICIYPPISVKTTITVAKTTRQSNDQSITRFYCMMTLLPGRARITVLSQSVLVEFSFQT